MSAQKEKILCAVMALAVVVALAMILSAAYSDLVEPAGGDLYVNVALPEPIAKGDLFVAQDMSVYFPGQAGPDKSSWGAPPPKAIIRPPVTLPLPDLSLPAAPAASTSPGPALEAADKLPPCGTAPKSWSGR